MSMMLILIIWNVDVASEEGNKRTDNIWLITRNYLIPPTLSLQPPLLPNCHMMFSYKIKPIFKAFRQCKSTMIVSVFIPEFEVHTSLCVVISHACHHYNIAAETKTNKKNGYEVERNGWISGMVGWLASQQASGMKGELTEWMLRLSYCVIHLFSAV